MSLTGLIRGFFSLLKNQKWKILFTLLAAVGFFIFLFPFQDLTDFVSATIAKQTQNQVQLTMDDMHLGIFPPGLDLKNAEVELGNLSPLKADTLSVRPSPTGIIHQKPYGTFEAQGLLNGRFKISVSSGKPSDNGVKREYVEAHAQKISLAELKNFLRLPIPFRGVADLQATSQVDFAWVEQPDGNLQLNVEKFEIPPASVPTAWGPIPLPEIALNQVELKGRLAAGKFIIDKGQFGKDSDEISGNIKGQMNVALRNRGDGTPYPELGPYNLEVDLMVKPSFEQKAGLFLNFLSAHKTPIPQGSRYHFKVSGAQWGGPPDISTVR